MTSPINPTSINAPTPNDDVIDKQERVEHVIDKRTQQVNADQNAAVAAGNATQDAAIATKANKGTAVIPATTAPGAAYVQAEAASVRAAVEAIRAALVASGVIAS